MANGKGLWQLIATAIALVAVLGLIWYLRQHTAAPVATPATQPTAPSATDGTAGAAVAPQTPNVDRVRRPRTQVPGVESMDAAQRVQLIKQIQDKLAEKQRAEEQAAAAAARAQPTPGSAPAMGTLDKEYIRDRIKEIVPLVKECYEISYADKPMPDAKIVVKFVIEGADELGGVVTSSEILNQEAEKQFPELSECMRETMYALRMKAPEGGGVVTVSYPFKFSSGASTQP